MSRTEKIWRSHGLKAKARHIKRIRRELEQWPRGGAGGFEPIGEVVKRVFENLNKDREE